MDGIQVTEFVIPNALYRFSEPFDSRCSQPARGPCGISSRMLRDRQAEHRSAMELIHSRAGQKQQEFTDWRTI